MLHAFFKALCIMTNGLLDGIISTFSRNQYLKLNKHVKFLNILEQYLIYLL